MKPDELSCLFPNGPFFDGDTAGNQTPDNRLSLFPDLVKLVPKILSPDFISVLEIGSWIGRSALAWSEAIANNSPGANGVILCIDPWEPYLEGDDLKKKWPYDAMEAMLRNGLAYSLFQHNARFANSRVPIQHIRGRLKTFFHMLKAGVFDIIYIDGSHYADEVRLDIALARALSREGVLICGDDLELQGDECDLEAAKNISRRDFETDPKTGKLFHPGVTVAVWERFGRVWEKNGLWAMQERNGEWIPPTI